MAYGDTMAYEFVDGDEKKTLRLTYNANTYLIYKRFFDSDLMGDILKATNSDKPLPKEIQNKILSGELTLDNLDSTALSEMQGFMPDTTFIVQAIVAMIASHEKINGIRRSVDEIANELPSNLFMDAEFISVFSEFLMFGIKKNKADISPRLSSVLVKRK